jgi:hypothetical protein
MIWWLRDGEKETLGAFVFIIFMISNCSVLSTGSVVHTLRRHPLSHHSRNLTYFRLNKLLKGLGRFTRASVLTTYTSMCSDWPPRPLLVESDIFSNSCCIWINYWLLCFDVIGKCTFTAFTLVPKYGSYTEHRPNLKVLFVSCELWSVISTHEPWTYFIGVEYHRTRWRSCRGTS